MKKVRYSGARSTTNQYIRLASRNAPIFTSVSAIADRLHDFYSANKGITYTAVLVKIIASVAKEYPLMNAILSRGLIRKHIFIPDEVDISLSMEKTYQGESVVAIPVIRSVNQKSIEALASEIKFLTGLPYDKLPFFKHVMFFFSFPDFLKYFILKLACQSPYTFKLLFGTIGFTTMGRFDIPIFQPAWINTLTFGIGKVVKKPVVIDDKIEIAYCLPLNMCFHHGVMDGGMAARILCAVKARIEEGKYEDL